VANAVVCAIVLWMDGKSTTRCVFDSMARARAIV
jgi:hypothetical protein